MAWLAVDEDKEEWIYSHIPNRNKTVWFPQDEDNFISIPRGTIEKIIGKKMIWKDEPIQI